MKEITCDASLENIAVITEGVDGFLEEAGCSMKVQISIDVAIDEIVSNIVNYGYKDTVGTVRVTVETEDNKATICFEDRGIPYNPLEKEDPDITLSAEERQIGGLGIFLVKKTMDDMFYEFSDGCNRLTIVKSW